jgi:hypothetical protein
MRRWIVPGIPFTFSAVLSLSTVGTYPSWQDSGLYLTAVKEVGVLYPPGFVLYEVLCRLWTHLLFFVDFTLAVHLFSSLCAAMACSVMAMSVRDLLRSGGKIFGGAASAEPALADRCAILVGLLMAGGFTFWFAATYAKVYAFYYLVLSLLLWSMIRADERRQPRDFTIVAALIGLAGHSHPSSVLAGLALVLFVAIHADVLGWKGILGRLGLAAACTAAPTLLILPLIVARDPWLVFGDPKSPLDYLRYLAGSRFVESHGVFGFDASRAASFGQFFWEELLGIGTLLTAVGLAAMGRRNRLLLSGLAAWLVPYAAVTILFKLEGQQDCWFVAACLPLYLAAGVGACELAKRAGRWATGILAGAAIVASAWAVAANYSDVSQRRYDLAELYGRTLLETPERDAILILSGDDANGLVSYLQRVQGVRPEATLVTSSFLFSEGTTGSDWYDRKLIARHPFLKRPDYAAMRERFPRSEIKKLAVAAFVNANAEGVRPIFTQLPVDPELLRPDYAQVPAGVYWKIVPREREAIVELRYWTFPVEPEQVRPRYRRARGQRVNHTPAGLDVKPERYERRLAVLILSARFRLALALLRKGDPAGSARLAQSILDYGDEEFSGNLEIIHHLGISYVAAGSPERAEPYLRISAEKSVRPESRATALYYLGEIARRKGDVDAARRLAEAALSVPGLDPAYRREMESRLPPK